MGRNRGLEFYENRDKYPIWRIVYFIFFVKLLCQFKKNYSYLVGMFKARKLYIKKKDYIDFTMMGILQKKDMGV